MISDLELIGRLALALVLCGLIGLERESRDRPAGLRTHILVGVGAALFTLVSAYGFPEFHDGGTLTPRADPTRIAAQIVSGIGFLGAGAIIRQGFNVRGLTTAATLWIVAAIGMAVGSGFYVGAIVATAMTLPALIVFRRLRGNVLSLLRQDIAVLSVDTAAGKDLRDVFGTLADRKVIVESLQVSHSEEGRDHAELQIRIPPDVDVHGIFVEISRLDAVIEAELAGRRWSADAGESPL